MCSCLEPEKLLLASKTREHAACMKTSFVAPQIQDVTACMPASMRSAHCSAARMSRRHRRDPFAASALSDRRRNSARLPDADHDDTIAEFAPPDSFDADWPAATRCCMGILLIHVNKRMSLALFQKVGRPCRAGDWHGAHDGHKFVKGLVRLNLRRLRVWLRPLLPSTLQHHI